ncbi:MAG: hypothetical protein VX754_07315 [Actinomycetota bacterium]|nr:hypothetical protein [Actinomycetota bacterium]MED5230697.1 hypothetical protein [Actinomycetota bacterium]
MSDIMAEQRLRKVEAGSHRAPTLKIVSDSKSWIRSTTAILVILIAIGFFGKVFVSALVVQRQAKIDKITQTISELDAINRSLLFEITKLESTERIYKIALADTSEEIGGIQGLGMVTADHTEFLQPLSSSNFSTWDNRVIALESGE